VVYTPRIRSRVGSGLGRHRWPGSAVSRWALTTSECFITGCFINSQMPIQSSCARRRSRPRMHIQMTPTTYCANQHSLPLGDIRQHRAAIEATRARPATHRKQQLTGFKSLGKVRLPLASAHTVLPNNRPGFGSRLSTHLMGTGWIPTDLKNTLP